MEFGALVHVLWAREARHTEKPCPRSGRRAAKKNGSQIGQGVRDWRRAEKGRGAGRTAAEQGRDGAWRVDGPQFRARAGPFFSSAARGTRSLFLRRLDAFGGRPRRDGPGDRASALMVDVPAATQQGRIGLPFLPGSVPEGPGLAPDTPDHRSKIAFAGPAARSGGGIPVFAPKNRLLPHVEGALEKRAGEGEKTRTHFQRRWTCRLEAPFSRPASDAYQGGQHGRFFLGRRCGLAEASAAAYARRRSREERRRGRPATAD